MIVIAFILYAATLIAIGAYSAYSTRNSSDFVMGGRSLNYVVTALAAHASDMGSWLFIGFTSAIYVHGSTECWAAVGLLAGMWATWRFIAPRLRALTEQTNSVTLSHFFTARSGDTSGLVTSISAIASLFFFLFYIASGLRGVSAVLTSAFGLPAETGILLGAAVVIAYTSLGGYLAVAWTDAFQGLFLLSMILLVPLAMYGALPADALMQPLSMTVLPQLSLASLGAALITALNWGIGYCGMPHVISKFMGIDSVDNMRKAQYVGLTWQTLALGAAVSIGALGRSLYPALANPESLFLTAVTTLFSPLMVGFILCAILAATISTMDSQVIVSATIIARDFMAPRTARGQVTAMRISIALLTGAAVCIALYSEQTLHEIVRYAWSGLGSTFGPAVITTLYLKSLTPLGLITGMGTGALVAAIWPFWGPVLTHAPMLPGFFFGMLAILVVSTLSRRTA